MKRFIKTREGWHLDAGQVSRIEEAKDGWVEVELVNGTRAHLHPSEAARLLEEDREILTSAQFGWEIVLAFADGTYAKAPIVAWRVSGAAALPVTIAPPPERPYSPVIHNSQSGHAFAEGSRGSQGLDEAVAAAIAMARERTPKAAE